jgi:NADPH:quinone reductase
VASSSRAKLVRLHEFGGPEVLRLDEVEVAPPGPGEALVRVAAFGLNRVEAIYRAGHFGPVRFPAKIGYEAAGIVAAVGPGVQEVAPGDRVAALFGCSMEEYGTYGEVMIYPAARLTKMPAGQTFIEAAASWMQYGTAYGLVEAGHLQRGDHVVITAASSSVGIAAIQIANDHGAVPIAVTRGRHKAAALRGHGAAYVIVSDEEDAAACILDITAGKGARILFDAVGGAALAGLLPALQPEGIAIIYGMLGGYELNLPLPPLMMANLTLRGWAADLLIARQDKKDALLAYVNPALAAGRLRPVIDRIFPLAQIAEAHLYLESNAQIGKIVVTTALAEGGQGDV